MLTHTPEPLTCEIINTLLDLTFNKASASGTAETTLSGFGKARITGTTEDEPTDAETKQHFVF